jgi:hypothetical protein
MRRAESSAFGWAWETDAVVPAYAASGWAALAASSARTVRGLSGFFIDGLPFAAPVPSDLMFCNPLRKDGINFIGFARFGCFVRPVGNGHPKTGTRMAAFPGPQLNQGRVAHGTHGICGRSFLFFYS